MTIAPLRLMLVDEDPVFRLGLRIWLEQTAGYSIVAEATRADDALAILASRAAQATSGEAISEWADTQATPADRPRPDLDLVIVDLGLGAGQPDQLPGLRLCADIKARYPALPVLVLSAQAEPVLEAAARQMGADGFGARSMAVADLGDLIQQLAGPRLNRQPAGERLRPEPVRSPAVSMREVPLPNLNPAPSALTNLRLSLRRSSVQQIEAVMAAIEAEQRRGRGSLLNEAVLAGRYRELRAARWLMCRLFATPNLADLEPAVASRRPERGLGPNSEEMLPSVDRRMPSIPPRSMSPRSMSQEGVAGSPESALTVATAERLTLSQGDLASLVFERVFNQLQGLLDNTSGVPLETDILRNDKKRELFYLVLRKVEDSLDNLRQAGVLPGQLSEKSPLVLQDLWQAAITDFFGRYYTLQVGNLEQPVVPTLLVEAPVVQAAILDRIPLVPDLLGHLLFNESLVVDGGLYEATSPEAMARSQALLEHLLIQLANAVVQPVLNHFADVELLKKNLYHRRLMTSRDIERFRNDLSWRYRWDGLINEPRAIFESQYRLFGFTERGIQSETVYSPRRDELEQLSGLQRAVTLAVEARDAIAPRFRSAVSLVGSGIVYVLTDVIGRGIGLIGRGILRGVGGAWRDPRYRRDSQDGNLRD
ncbi:DUF3685 domain-containing protein [Nodosilinea sp. LEGE 07298]|uniref:DUF3685 domain-containing protein n=1 Tax=Nodosilinea sp. LEGE 07298 TaxID=2777970 RepID=UPI001882EF7F|nr:DUF3685 domain-containing protein [Nodosilinea sp. LEGE 07298]MBE9108567.1 DUF3685 domain-containing protein [Nodosilinea sp. LEGE 07298]